MASIDGFLTGVSVTTFSQVLMNTNGVFSKGRLWCEVATSTSKGMNNLISGSYTQLSRCYNSILFF